MQVASTTIAPRRVCDNVGANLMARTILVVDDEVPARYALRRIFESGYALFESEHVFEDANPLTQLFKLSHAGQLFLAPVR